MPIFLPIQFSAAFPVASVSSELSQLARLYHTGDLTALQFEAAKTRVLDPSPSVGTTPQGVSAGFNVKDFGAFGDGKADDTAAFVRAFAAAEATYHYVSCSSSKGTACGRTVADVFVPAGRYLLTDSIELGGHTPGLHGEGTAMLIMVFASFVTSSHAQSAPLPCYWSLWSRGSAPRAHRTWMAV